jgi:5-formyltetrahydrofolate cyclo-ligase
MTKHQLRQELLARREAISPENRREYSQKITHILTSLPQFTVASTIHCYLSFGTEVETDIIRTIAFANGKKVAVPIVEKHSSMLFHRYISVNQEFIRGVWNIPVPAGNESTPISTADLNLTEHDIIIVPLVGFDRTKHRLGYGKGFYDRFLRAQQALTIGIGFSVQEEVSGIPFEPHDEVLSMIITENGCW